MREREGEGERENFSDGLFFNDSIYLFTEIIIF